MEGQQVINKVVNVHPLFVVTLNIVCYIVSIYFGCFSFPSDIITPQCCNFPSWSSSLLKFACVCSALFESCFEEKGRLEMIFRNAI
jgi:hypothetical protein